MDWYDDVYPIDNLRMDVYEAEPVYTGLLDADGNAIYRIKDKIGFLWVFLKLASFLNSIIQSLNNNRPLRIIRSGFFHGRDALQTSVRL